MISNKMVKYTRDHILWTGIIYSIVLVLWVGYLLSQIFF